MNYDYASKGGRQPDGCPNEHGSRYGWVAFLLLDFDAIHVLHAFTKLASIISVSVFNINGRFHLLNF